MENLDFPIGKTVMPNNKMDTHIIQAVIVWKFIIFGLSFCWLLNKIWVSKHSYHKLLHN